MPLRSGWRARRLAITSCTCEATQFVAYVPTTSISGFSAGLLALLPAGGQRVALESAEERDLARADLLVDDLREGLAERARVLADDGRVVLAWAGHVAPGVRADWDPRRVASWYTGR